MVLECPSPCENLVEFMRRHGGSLDEETVRQIMWQAAPAANMCCLRGVLHRDIKLENLLINRETSEVQLNDFGYEDILRRSPYKSYHDMYDIIHFFLIDTEQSCCTSYKLLSPAGTEYHSRGKYYCRPETVWSLGVLMFTMLCGRFPSDCDLLLLHYKHWSEPGLSKGTPVVSLPPQEVPVKARASSKGRLSPQAPWAPSDPHIRPEVSVMATWFQIFQSLLQRFL
ncbi:hypothetical protein cypCar_00027759 [Cyprinus carpio]|nr:hypothetical protein cypCar_00027759 [Cyprinus carpio]